MPKRVRVAKKAKMGKTATKTHMTKTAGKDRIDSDQEDQKGQNG